MSNIQENPLVLNYEKNSYHTRDRSVPFEKVKTEHYIPALKYGIKQAKENIEKIKNNPAPANFDNTILALESASGLVDQASNIYFNLFSSEASEAHQALAKDISPLVSNFSSQISLDEGLFKRIKAAYDARESLGLNAEQLRLTEKYYTDFTRNGALLNAADKQKLTKINEELSILNPQYSENVLKATNAFELVLENRKDLIGLPETVIEAAATDAEAKGHKGKWLFSLHAPSYVPFMQYAQDRELRKKMWIAYNSKAYKDNFDNQGVLKKMVALRHQRAMLLGYKNHAESVLQERMAKNPETVTKFLKDLITASKPAAMNDLEELKSFKKVLTGNEEVMPWDFSYYSEQLKEKKFKFNEEELRPYFKLENVIEGVFEHARRLYGLTFKAADDVEKYHPDVKVYEVRDESTKKYIGLLYTDFFPRETKKGGAWMTTYRDQGLTDGEVMRPHVSLVCNFTKPTPSKPSLLSYDEVTTLFHEFGHGLHGLLSQCTYKTLSGTNVYWDFVELPSQIMENWAREKEGLDLFARHYQTGQLMPKELVEKIKKAAQFQAGYFSLRQLNFASLDMAWHSQEISEVTDVNEFETKVTADTNLLPQVPATNSSCSFSHIFAGGYSAGYYSYKWAEVLDADAFEYFKEKGLFNKEVAEKFKNFVLSRGGTEHPMDLYKKFRGREPDPNALLRRDGLIQL